MYSNITKEEIQAIIVQGIQDHSGDDNWTQWVPDTGVRPQAPCSPMLHRLKCEHWLPVFTEEGLGCSDLCIDGGAKDSAYWPVRFPVDAVKSPCLLCKIYDDTKWLVEHILLGREIMEVERVVKPREGGMWKHIEQSRLLPKDPKGEKQMAKNVYFPLWQVLQLISEEESQVIYGEGGQLNFTDKLRKDNILTLLDTYRRDAIQNPSAGQLRAMESAFPSAIFTRGREPLTTNSSLMEQAKYKSEILRAALIDHTLLGSYREGVTTGLSPKRLRYYLSGVADAHTYGVMRTAFILTGTPVVDLPSGELADELLEDDEKDDRDVTLEWIDRRLSADKANVRRRLEKLVEEPRFRDLILDGAPGPLEGLWTLTADKVFEFEERLNQAIDRFPDFIW